MINKPKVVVGMSGGVDSSVAAALLKKQNYNVIGVFLKFWTDPFCSGKSKENTCCNQEALLQARKVALMLDIPFYVLDVSKEFKKSVVDYYIDEYQNGRTPNPCVECNKFIKFGWLLDKAKELGAEFIATGHYTRIKSSEQNFSSQTTPKKRFAFLGSHLVQKNSLPRFSLQNSKDTNKDQTYFLWQLNQEQLKHVLFPIGDYKKPEIRDLARKFKLPTAEKKESQGICFIPDRDNVGFLSRHIEKLAKPGKIVDVDGNILGKHKGLAYYTIGQRHGLEGIQLKVSGGIPPAYVVKLNIEKNQLIVGEEKDLYQKELTAEKVNWIDPTINNQLSTINCEAKIRYGHPANKCQVSSVKSIEGVIGQNKIKVIFEKPQRAITPGQSIVFYKKDELIGGGIIK